MKLSILIPAFNEEKTIVALISKVKAVPFQDFGLFSEIIVINDGSSDRTLDVLRSLSDITILNHSKNKGKGAAIKTGIYHCTGEIVIVQDADMEYDPQEIPFVVKPIVEGRADVVYGSRFLSSLQNKSNKVFVKHHKSYWMAYLGGRIVTKVTNLLFGSHLTDEPTCYKSFRSAIVKTIDITNNGFEWEPEITAKILKRGIKIKEVPISYYPRTVEEGKKINWRDGIRAIWTLLKYRLTN
ncbi:glycosyl transferase [Candidatus Woesearchaeota archaeon CG_4_10_14_0_2_um_filter_33_13]|nr:MAG: glycosyl transferase [Candidatus Woesearchaeota archaeon CG_4_10_14_0_2_um_filter_33_13]